MSVAAPVGGARLPAAPAGPPEATAVVDDAGERREPRTGFTRSLGYMTVAAVGFVAMGTFVQLAAPRVPILEIAAARAAIGAIGAYLVARVRHVPLGVGNRRVMWLRTVAGTAAMLCTFYALSVLPLAHVSALANTTPVFVAILGVVWLRERIGWLVGGALAVALAGAMLILDPHGGLETLAGLATLGAAVLSSIAMVSLRRLGATETPEAVVFHFSAVAAVVCLAAALPRLALPGALDALFLVGSGVGATVGQLAMTRAYQLDRAARVGAMGYMQILLSTAVGLVVLGQPLVTRVGLGIGAILCAGTLLVWSARRELGAAPGRAAR